MNESAAALVHKGLVENDLTNLRAKFGYNELPHKKENLALLYLQTFWNPLSAGVDFLVWVHFPDHRVLRTTAKRRMLKSLEADPSPETVVSYRGMLTHGNAHMLSNLIPER